METLMTRLGRRQKHKFGVEVLLEDLFDIPLVNASLYAKVRLTSGGKFSSESRRADVNGHRCYWGERLKFHCRIGSNPEDLLLEPCILRISIRKVERGGNSYLKLGYVDVNLSEFADSGVNGRKRTYLTEGYTSSTQRSDNSCLRINVSMDLLSMDTLFKVPRQDTLTHQSTQLNPADKKAPAADDDALPAAGLGAAAVDPERQSQNSSSSGFENELPEFVPGHSREASQGSGYVSAPQSAAGGLLPPPPGPPAPHSRQSSSGEAPPPPSACASASTAPGGGGVGGGGSSSGASLGAHMRRPSRDLNNLSAHHHPRPPSTGGKVDSTKVDADAVVNELLKDVNLNESEKDAENSGLVLFVNRKDGSAAFGSEGLKSSGTFERVVVPTDEVR